ncbi:hypothetical protein L218DRAFT_177712 [Marasmius fiardii PR-910]|nr:hypothetical protein L218DRAFT_177712 [Marasmius fiardii PR-910]
MASWRRLGLAVLRRRLNSAGEHPTESGPDIGNASIASEEGPTHIPRYRHMSSADHVQSTTPYHYGTRYHGSRARRPMAMTRDILLALHGLLIILCISLLHTLLVPTLTSTTRDISPILPGPLTKLSIFLVATMQRHSLGLTITVDPEAHTPTVRIVNILPVLKSNN